MTDNQKPEPMLFSVRAFGRFCLHLWAMMLTMGALSHFPRWFLAVAIVVLLLAQTFLWADVDRRRKAKDAEMVMQPEPK